VKKILFTLLTLTFFAIPPAHADTPILRIVDKPHLTYEGTFRNNDLATSLLPNSKLGKLIFTPSSLQRTFVIDAALVDEVITMSQGYTIDGEEDPAGSLAAQNWLSQLKFVVGSNNIVALAYGNPDEKLLKSIAPSELTYYSRYAQTRLQEFFGRTVGAENGWSTGVSRIDGQSRSEYSSNRRMVTGLSSITSAPEVNSLRVRLGSVLNPLLAKADRAFFMSSQKKAVAEISSRLRVTPGRYQITSESAKLPVTLVNEFDTPTVISVSLIPLNSRIQIENLNNIELEANSRLQILVPVDVLAPGSTIVLAQFINLKGQLVGEVSSLNLTATVIDARVAWFTTGAAVLLFVGAITQSVRRVRRSRK
jgi:hypothetical protein